MKGFERAAVTYVIGTYPRLTTTFIDREIAAVRRLGIDVRIVALRRPGGGLTEAPEVLTRHVDYVLPARPWTVARATAWVLATRPIRAARAFGWLMTRRYSSMRARVRSVLHFAESVVVAHMLRDARPETHHLHAHFVDRATIVALLAGRMLGLEYSATAHANDIYVNPSLLREKIEAARFVATCTQYNADHLTGLSPRAATKVVAIPHGIELPENEERLPADGPPTILAVGQLKEKKGFAHLIEACRMLVDAGHVFRCDIVGEGPLHETLEAQIERSGLRDVVTLTGALPLSAVMERYRSATLFALPCVLASDGDRDGIPNVILEAMGMGLAVVSTWHSGIPEAVINGETGVLVAPGDEQALAQAIARLLGDDAERARLGKRGREVVAERFSVDGNVARLVERMGLR